MSQLAQRVLTAVPMLVGIVLLLVMAPVGVTASVLGIVMVLGAWEWAAFIGWRVPLRRAAYAAASAVVLGLAAWLVPAVVPLEAILWIALCWWLLAFIWILRFPTPVPPAAATLAGILVLVPAWLAIVAILKVPERGPALVLLALSIVFAADIGAYFAGRTLGRRKLAPQVSPGKTWEGVAGGILLAAIVAGAGGAWLGLPTATMAGVGVGVAALSVVGDLTESMFKRSAGVKDSGNLIPGHGGVLDRLDSITAAMPLFALTLPWLGLS